VSDTVSITIDGTSVVAPAGATIMAACDLAGIYVPRMCAYPGLGQVGDCGLCFVRVEGSGSAEGGEARRACSVKAVDGMVVSTTDPQAQTFRRNSMADILGDHPHVCLTCPLRDGCDRNECMYGNPPQVRCCGEFGRCEIAKVAAYVGALEQAPAYQFRALGESVDHQIRRDLDLCVGCGRCVIACDTLVEAGKALQLVATATLVGHDPGGALYMATEAARIAAEVAGDGVSAIAEWKPKSYLGRNVAVPKQDNLRASGCTFCGACVMVCPSGALTAVGAKGAAWLAKRRARTTLAAPVLPPEDRLPFTADAVDDVAPGRAGVFVLYDAGGNILQISGAADLRAGLGLALSDSETGAAVSFTCEDEHLYTQRESELLARHLQAHGRMPRGNDIVGLFGDDDDEGWVQRFSASGARLQETADYYRSLGYEVRVESLADVAAEGSCTTCFAQPTADGPTGVIFTRAGATAPLDEAELFADDDPASEGE
jgi:ferredoxin